MASRSLFSIALCFFLLCHGSLGYYQRGQQQQQRPFRDQSECRVQSLSALEPTRRVESEAGFAEHWDENNEQLDCAGVAATRYTIQPRGLLLPSFADSPRLVYIVQGRGITGALFPGCPASFQSFQQSPRGEQGRSQRFTDQHQKIRHFREGDILALPEGVAHWCYNDGETPVVVIAVFDTSSNNNQLDRNLRRFHLAGTQQSEARFSYPGEPTHQDSQRTNIFGGFDVRILAEAFGVSVETARKLQNENDQRGDIVRVENGLKVVRPPREQEECNSNGLEEVFCNMRLRENIDDPSRADVYSPQGGRISSLNNQKLPILRYIQMSAVRGVLYRNALVAPYWNMNSHSVIYVTRGRARVQISGSNGRPAFDGELQQGQLVIVPQMFAVLKQARDEGFEYIAFKTNDNAMTSPLAGKASTFRGMPEEVLMNSYRITREEARRLKNNRRDEVAIFSPRSRSQRSAYE